MKAAARSRLRAGHNFHTERLRGLSVELRRIPVWEGNEAPRQAPRWLVPIHSDAEPHNPTLPTAARLAWRPNGGSLAACPIPNKAAGRTARKRHRPIA
jgi:hypothetical protein